MDADAVWSAVADERADPSFFSSMLGSDGHLQRVRWEKACQSFVVLMTEACMWVRRARLTEASAFAVGGSSSGFVRLTATQRPSSALTSVRRQLIHLRNRARQRMKRKLLCSDFEIVTTSEEEDREEESSDWVPGESPSPHLPFHPSE